MKAMGVICLLLSLASVAWAQVDISTDTLDVDPAKSTLVDLDLKNISVQQAFDELCSQAKIPTRVDVQQAAVADKIISVKCVKMPWAEALLRVAREADIGVFRNDGCISYTTQPVPKTANQTERGENWIYGPISDSGPFCCVFDQVWCSRNLQLDDPSKISRSLMIKVDIVPEPQILIYSRNPWLNLPHVQDENGLQLKDNTGIQMIHCMGENVYNLTGVPAVPDNIGHELAEITARHQLGIVRKFRRIEIAGDDLLGGTNFTTDGIAATLLQPNIKKMEYTLKLKAGTRDPALISDGTLCVMMDDADRVMSSARQSEDVNDSEVKLVNDFWPMSPSERKSHPLRLLVYLPLEGGIVSPEFKFTHVPLDAVGAKGK